MQRPPESFSLGKVAVQAPDQFSGSFNDDHSFNVSDKEVIGSVKSTKEQSLYISQVEVKSENGNKFMGYCCDVTTLVDASKKYHLAKSHEIETLFPIETIKKLRQIVNLGFPVMQDLDFLNEMAGTYGLTYDSSLLATQAAIWSLTNPSDYATSNQNPENINKLTQYLLENKNSGWDMNDVEERGKRIKFTLDKSCVIETELENYKKFGPFRIISDSIFLKNAKFDLDLKDVHYPEAYIIDSCGKKTNEVELCEEFYILVKKHCKIDDLHLEVCVDVIYGCDIKVVVCNEGTKKSQAFIIIILKRKRICECFCVDVTSKGCVEVIKYDDCCNECLDGAMFALYNCCGELVACFSEKICGITEGCYILIEEKAPDGYFIDKTPIFIHVESGKTTTLKIENKRKPVYPTGVLRITKYDSCCESNLLGGAVFNVYDCCGKLVDTITTEHGEHAYSCPLPTGIYKIVETTAPEGYKLNLNPYLVEIVTTNNYTEVNVPNEKMKQPRKGQFKIHVSDEYCPCNTLCGFEFEVYNHNGTLVDTIVTDEHGNGTSEMLRFGNYRIVNTDAPNGYKLFGSPIFITIHSDLYISLFELLAETYN